MADSEPATSFSLRNFLTLNQPIAIKCFSLALSAVFILKKVISDYTFIELFAVDPSRTIHSHMWWNLFTPGYVEPNFLALIFDILALAAVGRNLISIWGTREFVRFILICNFGVTVCAFLVARMFEQHSWCGFSGAIAACTVGIKQLTPEHEHSLLFIHVKSRFLPSVVMLLAVALYTLRVPTGCVIFSLLGVPIAYVYLKYAQLHADGHRGDPSEAFTVASFFPDFLEPHISRVTGLASVARGSQADAADGLGLPQSCNPDAERRRTRALKAVDSRLKQMKHSAAGGPAHPDLGEDLGKTGSTADANADSHV